MTSPEPRDLMIARLEQEMEHLAACLDAVRQLRDFYKDQENGGPASSTVDVSRREWRGRPVPPGRDAEMLRLRAEGLSLRKIGARFGLTGQAVNLRLRQCARLREGGD